MNYYLLGVGFGILLALVIVLVSCIIRRKHNANLHQYDERQMIGRGKSFQAGFFTLLIAEASCSILEYSIGLPGVPFLWHISALLLGVAVFAVTAVHYDAYISMNQTPKAFLQTGLLFILSMSLSGLSSLHNGRPEGKIMGTISLEVGLLWAVILIALWLHRTRTKAEEEE